MDTFGNHFPQDWTDVTHLRAENWLVDVVDHLDISKPTKTIPNAHSSRQIDQEQAEYKENAKRCLKFTLSDKDGNLAVGFEHKSISWIKENFPAKLKLQGEIFVVKGILFLNEDNCREPSNQLKPLVEISDTIGSSDFEELCF